MTPKERVKRAIEFKGPDRIPVYADEQSDVVRLSYVDPTGWAPRNRPSGDFMDEWGSLWYTKDETQGHVKQPAIKNIEEIDKLIIPDPQLPARWGVLDSQIEAHRSQYIVGNAQYLLYDRLTFLLGQVLTLESLIVNMDALKPLMDRIIEFELAIVDNMADRKVDGIRFWDDVGSTNGVIMGPKIWRNVLGPYYQRVFRHIHDKGLHVHWHSCGNCFDIMEDLVEMGVDVFSIGEPFMMGLEKLSEKFKGRVCFDCSPDNRSVLSKGNKQDIETALAKMISVLSARKGGLILIAAADNFDCLSAETRRMVIDAVLQARSLVNHGG